MTEFRVEVIQIGKIEKHPNADTLSIVNVHGGYPCIIKTVDFQEGDLAVYIPIDALVPVNREEFSFLSKEAKNGYARIRAAKRRGIFSMGLLIPAPKGVKIGDLVQEQFEILKWLPPAEQEPVTTSSKKKVGFFQRIINFFFGKKKIKLDVPYYDLEGLRKYNKLLVEGEQVVITEKIHGAQFRACYTNKRFYLGSRNIWGRESNTNNWSKVASQYKLQEKLKNYPDLVLYGEVYGDVQDLKYGMKQNEVDLVVFDFMNIKTRKFLDFEDTKKLCEELQIPHVPILYQGPWNEELKSLCEGKTTIQGANHVREGIVVKRIQEIPNPHFGRVILKLPGEGYLLRKVKENL